MIYFILDRGNSFPIRKYLKFRGKSLAEIVGIICYDELDKLKDIKCNTLIFSDFDRLTPVQLSKVVQIYNQVKKNYPGLRLLNDPSKVKLRYELLSELYKIGINPFRVFRMSENLNDLNYPVFIREENNHTGALSELIYTRKKLEKSVLALILQGYSKKNLLAAEFVNVGNRHGVFKKYSALKFYDDIFPRQVDYNFHWMVKTSIRFNRYPKKEFMIEFTDFMKNHPHREFLTELFETAGIEYGRVDYGMLNGKPVVWEINLNPDYGGSKRKRKKKNDSEVTQLRDIFHRRFKDKFLELNSADDMHVQLNIDDEVVQVLQPSKIDQIIRVSHKPFKTKKPLFKILANGIRTLFLILAILLFPVVKVFGYNIGEGK